MKASSSKGRIPASEIEFQRQVQEFAASLLFPGSVVIALLVHGVLLQYSNPRPKLQYLVAHLPGLATGLLPYHLFSQAGYFGIKLLKKERMRSWISLGCLCSFFLLWIMVLADRRMVSELPGARILGVLFGALIGTWVGILSHSCAALIEMINAQNRRKIKRR